jgi:hypothetical protein
LNSAERMKSYLPVYYENSPEMQAIMDAGATEFDDLKTKIKDGLDQWFVDTATWGLARSEKILEIPTDLSKPLDQRRSVIKSKLRGIGKVDVYLIKNVADAYTNGEVVVSFNGRIIIKFTSKIGTPPNLDDLKNVLSEIIPYHLRIEYQFRYLLIKEIHNVMTINQMQATKLDSFAGGVTVG